MRRASAPAAVARRKRDDSRSQKMPPKLLRGPGRQADRLGEEDGALAVVAVRVVDQLDRHELAVVELLALELGDELGPRRAHDERLEARVRRAVGRVHGEDDEVLDAVAAVLFGAKQGQRRP